MSSAVPKFDKALESLAAIGAARLPSAAALRTVKQRALDEFLARGYPTQRDEDWKYTSLKRLETRSFEMAATAPIAAADIENQAIDAPEWLRLVFVNGHFAAGLSSALPSAPGGADSATVIRPLSAVIRERPDYAAALLNSAESTQAEATPFAATQPGATDIGLTQPGSVRNARAQFRTPGPASTSASTLFDDSAPAASPLIALNTALTEDGLVIELGAGVILPQPIYCLFVWSGQFATQGNQAGAAPQMTHPRVIVRLGRDARAQLVEHFVGGPGSTGAPSTGRPRTRGPIAAEGPASASGQGSVSLKSAPPAETFTNSVTQVQLEAGARLEHYRVQEEGARSFHLGEVWADLQRDAAFVSHSMTLGASLSRLSTDVYLRAAGAHTTLGGLFFADGTRHADVHTRIEHLAPRTQSVQDFRGIADGRGRGVYNGKVRVAQDAQKISAQQSSRNLLLSGQCEIDTKPELEIYADDVKCSHGATTGQLDAAALFYLRSRGIEEDVARGMLIEAFAESVLTTIELLPLRQYLEKNLQRRFGWDEERV